MIWDGLPLPERLKQRLEREWAHREWLNEGIREVEAERWRLLRTSEEPAVEKVWSSPSSVDK